MVGRLGPLVVLWSLSLSSCGPLERNFSHTVNFFSPEYRDNGGEFRLRGARNSERVGILNVDMAWQAKGERSGDAVTARKPRAFGDPSFGVKDLSAGATTDDRGDAGDGLALLLRNYHFADQVRVLGPPSRAT